MSPDEIIRTSFPYHLAKLHEIAHLEGDPRLRVIKLVELYEHTLRHMALVGLAQYNYYELDDPLVEDARSRLDKPSLGHWLTCLRSLDDVLSTQGKPLFTPTLNKSYLEGCFFEAAQELAPLAEIEFPKKVRLSFLLDLVVQFRNKKIGHGSLSEQEAEKIVQPFETFLSEWLSGLTSLHQNRLVYIRQVSWQDPHYLYDSVNLTVGTSIYRIEMKGEKTLTPKRMYLQVQSSEELELIPLYPFFSFDYAENHLYIYNEVAKNGNLILRCPYDNVLFNVDADVTSLLGDKNAEKLPQESTGTSELSPRKSLLTDVEATENKEFTFMKSWYDIITPHEDIRKGEFDEAVFHADLADVADGNAPADYRDPYLFYKKTYPTAGLQNLLQRVYQTLSTGAGSSVVQIQTPFGGGKSHALVAIYHYLKNGHKIKELLPNGLELITNKVVAISGDHWNPVEGKTTDGVTRWTFWGDVAYQIGGVEGYEIFRQNDESRISPGKDKLRSFLEAHQPFVLLFDEILEYINRALDEKYDVKGKTDVSLGTQTFSFFQELTEAVAAIPKGILVVTLPSSYLEDFSENEEASLTRLNKIFGRLESIETPVQGEEVYAVIRRRLFEVEGLKAGPMREIVQNYFQVYQQYHDDLPPKIRDANYREKMEMAYPFHPDVIDILYEKWSTFSTFQRTRGVLRLLANIVEDLYQREVPLDLILPGDINLDRPSIRQEFLKHIGLEYEGVIGSDIAGHEAKSILLDSANKPWKHLAQLISTLDTGHF